MHLWHFYAYQHCSKWTMQKVLSCHAKVPKCITLISIHTYADKQHNCTLPCLYPTHPSYRPPTLMSGKEGWCQLLSKLQPVNTSPSPPPCSRLVRQGDRHLAIHFHFPQPCLSLIVLVSSTTCSPVNYLGVPGYSHEVISPSLYPVRTALDVLQPSLEYGHGYGYGYPWGLNGCRFGKQGFDKWEIELRA